MLIGAGAIGLEFALRYARQGSSVTVIARSRPLSAYPQCFGQQLEEIYEREGVCVLQATSPQRIRRDCDGLYVVETDGAPGFKPVTAARVMLVVGRQPAIETLDLHRAGVELTGGKMTVSEDLRVEGGDNLFATGDMIGRRMVVHQAHIEAGIAAENAVADGTRIWDRRSDIQVVFCDPEFATLASRQRPPRRPGTSWCMVPKIRGSSVSCTSVETTMASASSSPTSRATVSSAPDYCATMPAT